MTHVVFTVEAEADAYEALCNKSRGYPSKGRHVGGGVHVAISDTPGVGWTLTHGKRKHPTRGEWAVEAVEPAGKLSAAEETELAAKYAARQALNASWISPP